VKNITTKTVDMPRIDPMTGPAIQTEDNDAVVVTGAEEGVELGVAVAVGVWKLRVLFKDGLAVDVAEEVLDWL